MARYQSGGQRLILPRLEVTRLAGKDRGRFG